MELNAAAPQGSQPVAADSPLQRELAALYSGTRIRRSAVAMAILPNDIAWSLCTAVGVLGLLWPSIARGDDGLGAAIALATGFLMLGLLQLMKLLFVYPAIRGREVALVQKLRRVLFREGVFMDFLLEEDRQAKGQAAPADNPLDSARQLVLPQIRKSVAQRFFEHAQPRLFSHAEFSHLRSPLGKLELRAALASAIREEFRREEPPAGQQP